MTKSNIPEPSGKENRETFLQMAIRHRDQDLLMAGLYGLGGARRACSVGCFNRDYGNRADDHAALAESTGYPKWAHLLQDDIFEGLPENKRANFHVDFARTCEGVTDWQAKFHKTMIAILGIALPHDTSEGQVVQAAINLHKRGASVTDDEWAAAETAARSAILTAETAAADAAARAAVRATVWRAEWSAAKYAVSSAGTFAVSSATGDAARFAASDAARHAAWVKIAEGFNS